MAVEAGYPVVMVHPQHRAAKIAKDNDLGAPEQFSNVTVNSVRQEAEHRSKGYLRFGEAPPGFADYHEYPKFMRHPDYEPATEDRIEPKVENNHIVGSFVVKGQPARNPDVTATDAASEAMWREKGYRPAGEYNKSALNASLLHTVNDEVYEPQGYPRWGTVIGDDGKEKQILIEHDPNVDRYEPTSEFPKLVDGVVVADPRLPPEPDPRLYPMWVHKNGKPSDASLLAKTPQEEFAIRKRWESEETTEESVAEASVVPPAPTSSALSSVRRRSASA